MGDAHALPPARRAWAQGWAGQVPAGTRSLGASQVPLFTYRYQSWNMFNCSVEMGHKWAIKVSPFKSGEALRDSSVLDEL